VGVQFFIVRLFTRRDMTVSYCIVLRSAMPTSAAFVNAGYGKEGSFARGDLLP
jgi:hypothetical protein